MSSSRAPGTCSSRILAEADFDIRVRNFISRVGLNYKFDWGKAPVAVMAKY